MAKRHIDYYLDIINKKSGSGGGGQSVTVEQLNVSANGTYTAQSGHAYSPVVVNTPTPKTEDVLNVSANGTYTPQSGHTYSEVNVNTPVPKTEDVLNASANGTYTPESGHVYSEVNVNVPSSGGAVDVERKDINFFSWDGHRIMSFTKAEVDAMTELPPVPVVEGFTNGVWNWTIEQLHNHDGKANVGPYYDYAGTASKFIMDITHEVSVQIQIDYATDDGGTLDWGDGSPVERFSWASSSTMQRLTHTYQPGRYEMLITGDSISLYGVTPGAVMTEAYFVEGHAVRQAMYGGLKQSGIKRMIGGGAMTAYPEQLEFCVYHPNCSSAYNVPCGARHICYGGNISHITTSQTEWRHAAVEEIYTGAVDSVPVLYYNNKAFGLKCLTDLSIRNSNYGDEFRDCTGLKDIVLPSPLSQTSSYAFGGCRNLFSVEFPATLTNLNGFSTNLLQLQRVRFNGTTPPAVASSSVFQGMAAREGAVIEVPAEALDAYKTATNLSQFADIMEGF